MDDEDQAYDLIRRHLLKSRGFDISGYSRSFLGRCVRKRVGRTNSRGVLEYVGLLRRDEEELNELISALSINVTDFFRDRGAFESLSERVIRPLIKEKTEQGWSALRIWSAGCASGQETYTIAMCVAEELRRTKDEQSLVVRITGTDLSRAALERAREGVYTRDRVKALPKRLLGEYFERRGSDYAVSESLRRFVKFSEGNLLDPPTNKHFDVIVCRNVVIYFSRSMHDLVIKNLHSSLRSRGYIMLGRTETLMGSPRQLFEVIDHENRIFRKIEGSRLPQVPDSANRGVSDRNPLNSS